MAGFIQSGAAEVFNNIVREVRAKEDLGKLRPDFDSKEHADYLKREADGRKSNAYHQALVYHGFRYVPRDRLLPMDGRPHEEGMWKNPKLGAAFYPSDLVTLFKGGPGQFDRWCREQALVRAQNKPPKAEIRKILKSRT